MKSLSLLALLTFGLVASTVACATAPPTAFEGSNLSKDDDDEDDDKDEDKDSDKDKDDKPATKTTPNKTTTPKPADPITPADPVTPTPNPPNPTPQDPEQPPPGGGEGDFACFEQCVAGNAKARAALQCEGQCQDEQCAQQCFDACFQDQNCGAKVDQCDQQCGFGGGEQGP